MKYGLEILHNKSHILTVAGWLSFFNISNADRLKGVWSNS